MLEASLASLPMNSYKVFYACVPKQLRRVRIIQAIGKTILRNKQTSLKQSCSLAGKTTCSTCMPGTVRPAEMGLR